MTQGVMRVARRVGKPRWLLFRDDDFGRVTADHDPLPSPLGRKKVHRLRAQKMVARKICENRARYSKQSPKS
jgi:hypothetical protein